ncbi:MAG: redoxin domain-containing protein [Clostridia bacterium]|nr:redoxin domain-containing protein [Clostridia bacterium]
MDNARKKCKSRHLVQLYSALLYNAHIRGFINGQIYRGQAKFACVPGLNCYSCPGAAAACPLGAIQNALASAGHRAGWYVLGILLLFGTILGRTVCGWLCPVGLAQELLNKIPTPKLKKSRVTRVLSLLKYVILAVFVVGLPLGYALRHDLPLPAFCKYICPAGTSEGAILLLSNPANASFFDMLGALFTRKFVVLTAIGLTCIFCYRAFCRFVCPLGAIYSLFSRFNVIGVKVDESRCNRCGACVGHCGMDVRRVGDRECISCGACMDVCSRGAISFKAGKLTLKAPETDCSKIGPARRRRLARAAWALALAALGFALLWFNALDPSVKGAEAPAGQNYESDAPVGSEVGQQLGDFSIACYDGSVFRLGEQRGRITVINLWATYCAPCKQELPYFSDLYAARKDDMAMIAIHPSLVADDPQAYLEDKGFAMPFATDADDTVAGIVGFTGTLPQTVVLNRRGEVVYNQPGSVTPELLASLCEAADE